MASLPTQQLKRREPGLPRRVRELHCSASSPSIVGVHANKKKNGAISLKVVNSRIPPPFANRLFGEQYRRW